MTHLPITSAIDVCWRSIVGEARSCCYADMVAVGYVLRERALSPGWWWSDWQGAADPCGDAWARACQNPSQVNAWGSEPNLRVMRDPWGSNEPQRVIWRCMSAAIAAVCGTDEDAPIIAWRNDLIYRPSHYIERDAEEPDWADPMLGTIQLYPRWESAFKWYANVPGDPPRARQQK